MAGCQIHKEEKEPMVAHDLFSRQESKGELKAQLDDLYYQERFQEERKRAGERIVYLTFDDGPTENTKAILSILRQYEVKASFFVNGRDSDFAKGLYQEIVQDGHTLGNHTYTHQYETIYSSLENFKDDFYRLQKLLSSATGEEPDYFRFPGGSNSFLAKDQGGEETLKEIRQYLKDNGYVFYDWNVDSRDSAQKTQPANIIIKETLNQVKDKNIAIVLFHDGPNKETTVEALPVILSQLKEWGFTFKPLSRGSPKKQFRL